MNIDVSRMVIRNFDPYDDLDRLGNLFAMMPPSQFAFVEISADIVTFQDAIEQPSSEITVRPILHSNPIHFTVFSHNEIIRILNRAPVDFGNPYRIAIALNGRLRRGVVLQAVRNEADNPRILGHSFAQLRHRIPA